MRSVEFCPKMPLLVFTVRSTALGCSRGMQIQYWCFVVRPFSDVVFRGMQNSIGALVCLGGSVKGYNYVPSTVSQWGTWKHEQKQFSPLIVAWFDT